MFRVRSSFKGKLKVDAPLQAVKNFFANLSHFTEMLGGVEAIRREPGGIARWTIATDTPVGNVRFSFPVRESSPRADILQRSPAANERQNLLLYSLNFEESNNRNVGD